MNGVSTGRGVPDQPGGQSAAPTQRESVQRALMEQARRSAELDQRKPPSRTLQHTLALAAALAVVGTLVFGFDAFLSSMQRVMRLLDEDAARQQAEQPLPQPDEPIPAYVVPAD